MKSLWRNSWLLIFIVFSCSRPRENCLDINATNYDVRGEVPCETCCTYPNLGVRFRAGYSGEPLVLNQFIYENSFGESYGVVSGKLLLSHIVLSGSAGTNFRLRDSIFLPLRDENSLFFKNDFLFISDLTERTYRLGVFPVANDFTRIGIHLGLRGEACNINPIETPASENIGRALRGLYEQEFDSYYSARFEILTDTMNTEMRTKVIYLPLCDMTSGAFFNIDRIGTPGFDLIIQLNMDVKKVLANIKLSELDSLNVISQWKNDLLSGLYIE